VNWDIFCRVIDNFGDIGVCWRLSAALAKRGQAVRLWVDDASALTWMAPQGCEGVQVRAWQPDQPMPGDAQPGDVVIEAFGCELQHDWIAMYSIAKNIDQTCGNALKSLQKPVWINLEYLSAESYAERSHGLPSPILSGAAKGLTKWFFYPGFTAGTGGLIREADAVADPHHGNTQRRISLFCYEPAALPDLLDQLAASLLSIELCVLPGRGQKALQAIIDRKTPPLRSSGGHSLLSIQELSFLSQPQYDTLLGRCDLNFVRGEDSLVRAIWAGRAFVWHIYPQADGAQAAKLEAFLDWLQAPEDWREFHRVWNGLIFAPLPTIKALEWTACALAARQRLLQQPDLVSQLLDFVRGKS
jgi:uncharacterized repeat protein (TIGR03837 family)